MTNEEKMLSLIEDTRAIAYKEFAEILHKEIEKAMEYNRNARKEHLAFFIYPMQSFLADCDRDYKTLQGVDHFIAKTYRRLVGDIGAESNQENS